MRWFISLLLLISWQVEAAQPLQHIQAEGDFDDIKTAMIEQIQVQGFSVSHVSNVGGMLQRTGKDLGYSKAIYGQAVVIEFCSAYYSRQMMSADPKYLHFCPFKISLYTLPKLPNNIHVLYQLPNVEAKQNPWLSGFESIMQDIVETGTEGL